MKSTRVNTTVTQENVHTYDNGVKIYSNHIGEAWRIRFAKNAINLHEPEEEEYLLATLKRIVPNGAGTFFDIGAGVGYYAILVKKSMPFMQVHAFEPLQLHLAHIKANIALNQLSEQDVILHHEAISNTNGMAKFEKASFGSALVKGQPLGWRYAKKWMHRTIKKALRPAQWFESRYDNVPTRTLDNVIERPVTFVKVDVQGFEMDVLRGSEQSIATGRIGGWLIGTHSAQLHTDCLDFIWSHGYKVIHNDPHPNYQPDGIIIAVKSSSDANNERE